MVEEIPFPEECSIAFNRNGDHFCDAYEFEVADMTAQALYQHIFCDLPPLVKRAMTIRNHMVKPFGFTTYPIELPQDFSLAVGEKFGLHTIEVCNDHEVIAHASEHNMSIWISLTKSGPKRYTMACVVNMKTRLARAYVGFIIPFHRIVVKMSVKRALNKLKTA
ncbi:DUF2867 domain-containing protein [Vibrio sonorensis]|uniref:DUF2867 domain-containing protein n=1 Tax=Vibrio sonorensis TaxID=1004316 RepID=UPI0008D94952|nr:DUF2867 domain-containing protein [Vibrio sonorensis]